MPAETATAICCMTMGGVLEKFPKLKVCFAHGGECIKFLSCLRLSGVDVVGVGRSQKEITSQTD